MKDYKEIIKNCIKGTADHCKRCPYTGKGCTVKLLEDVLMHIQVKDRIIECLNVSYNGLAQEHHKLKLENVYLKEEIINVKNHNQASC